MSVAPSMMYSSEIGTDELRLTAAAQAKLAELQSAAEDEVVAVRIFVSGGGCSGMTYGMTYTDALSEYDRVMDGPGFRVVIDAVALNYLAGCEIDYRDDPISPRFVFNNVFQSVGGSGTCGGCGAGGCGA